jgi:FixJ family two-component response regulator
MKNSEFSNKNIAKALKISPRTVHRVINNNKRGSISEEQKFVLELRNQNLIKKYSLVSMRN